MNPAAFSVHNRALVNAAFILIVAVGVHSLLTIPRELNPQVEFNWAFITTVYPGATPEEVEDLVTIPIEDEAANVDDIDVILSNSRAGSSFVWVKFNQVARRSFERRVDDVRARLVALNLPENAEDPDVDEFSTYDMAPVASVIVYGTADERVLHDEARRLRDDLRDIDGVADVRGSFGDRDPAVVVECDPHQLERHGLDAADVEAALRLANLNLPAGLLDIGGESYLLRTRSRFEGAEDVASVVLRAGLAGTRVRVGDVADVHDGFHEREVYSRFNGLPSITLALTKDETGNTIDIVERARELVERRRASLPPGLQLTVANDESLLVEILLGVLESNALLGLLLVVLVLLVFIGWRGALCAALGIPVTFLLAVVALDWFGYTLNGNTLFALILVLGMVVDDAIVILENSYRHLQEGKPIAKAVTDGVREVVSPVAVSSFTTMAGFLPLVLMPGIIGRFMRIIPVTVALVLLASLAEAFWILPSHFVDIVRRARPGGKGTRLERWHIRYRKMLERALQHRYVVVVGTVLLLIASLALIPLIGVELFASDEFSTIRVEIRMPDGTRLEATDEVIRRFEAMAMDLPEHEIEGIIGNTGIIQGMEEWTFGPHVGQVWIDVVEARERNRSVAEIIADLRERMRSIPGPVRVRYATVESGPPADEPVELLIKGSDLDELAEVSRILQEELRSIPGTIDVRDDLDLNQPRLDVVVDYEAAARRGLDPTRIAANVRAAFASSEMTTFRAGDEEVDVIVRFPKRFRRSPEDVTALRFATAAGNMVPFPEVARLEGHTSPLIIRRHDRDRAVTVMCDVDQSVTDIAAVSRAVLERFQRLQPLHPDVRVEPGGQFREFWEAFESLSKLFALGLLLNFMLMAGQFKSWSQPLIILAVVPLSFIGAMVGLLAAQSPFSIATLYGFVALAGVAVNDSIVLVDFINQARAAGLDRWESLLEAGRLRLRPIFLTTVTTVFGLLPMAVGLGGQSATWQPLAATIAAGLVVATVICLVVIPCLQAILDDLGELTSRGAAGA